MTPPPLRPADLPGWRQRSALRLLNLAGWKLLYRPLPGPHGIAVVYPHTSNWDFPIGLLGKWALNLPFRWLAKDALFKGPLGILMRYWGGIAIDRSAPQGATRKLADQILASPWCWVAITPEATRGYRPHWKSGFYHLAMTAQVPLLLVYFDYRRKEVGVLDTLTLSGDQDADMGRIAAVYQDRTARYPALAAPIMLAPPHNEAAPRKRA